MKKIHLILILCLLIVVAVLGIGYLSFGSKDEESSEDTKNSSYADEEETSKKSFEKQDDEHNTAEKDTDSESAHEHNTAEKNTDSESAHEQTTVKKPTDDESLTRNEEEAEPEYEYAYAGFNPSTAVISEEKWNLLLVNRNYILPDDFTVRTAAVKGGTHSLDYRVVPYYDQMVTAAEADGISLIPVSGYRSVERQRANFERKINYYMNQGNSKVQATILASEIVLMPSTSEHNAGLAMDFGTEGNTSLEESFAETEAFEWLSENAADYGFILRYTKEAKDITMVTYEPWHWRYVGVKAAKEIKASGVTLEEYLGMD